MSDAMMPDLSPTSRRFSALFAAMVIAWGASDTVRAQQPSAADAGDTPDATSLLQRQRAIRDRMQRLEGRMLQLSQLLSENEPEKAERLRDALELVGARRIKARFRELTELIENDQLGEADQRQETLLSDLDSLLTMLTSSLNEIERRRAERERLEQMKQSVRALFDEQMRLLQRTRRAAAQSAPAGEPDGAGEAENAADTPSTLERLQRETQRRTEDALRDLEKEQPPDGSSPGGEPLKQASENMSQAARSLGDEDLNAAEGEQQEALEQLQKSLDALEDALRQVRREESEETLDALETRVRSMLTREKQVLEAVQALAEKGVESWTRSDELELAGAEKTHLEVGADCETTLRILVDEGTTVIVPELIRQAAADMKTISDLLDRDDVSAQTRDLLTGVVATLEELLAAIEQKRDADMRDGQGGSSGGGDSQPLLPASAELKLLRSSQVRINERTLRAAGDDDADAAAAGVLQQLSLRQRRLAELARQMNERN